ncbi:MAG: restriction endonuclease subunit S [Acidobacteriota bacterium]
MTKRHKLPQGWRWATLGDIAEIGAGNSAPQGLEYFAGGEHPFVRTRDVGREGKTPCLVDTADRLNDHALQSRHFRLWPESTLLIPKSGASTFLNHRALLGRSAYVSSHLATVVAEASVLPEYLYFFSLTVDARDIAAENDYPSLRLPDIAAVAIPLPPLPTQERIVEILRLADSIRHKRADARRLADQILPATFNDLFGDLNPSDSGAELVRLGDVADIRAGVTKGRRLQGRETVVAPYLRVANVQDGFLDLEEIRQIAVLPSDVQKFHLDDGDVLMTEGGDPDKLGRGCVWRGQIEGCIHQNHVFRVRVNRLRLLPEFLLALLRTRYAKRYFFHAAKRSSNLASVNSTQVKNFRFPLPPMETQRKFLLRVERWDKAVGQSTEAIHLAERTFAALSSRAFTGQLTGE